MLTLHQLQVFVTVAEQGSVRRAAEVLVVSQPAVSASLASLEKAVGVELVARAGRGLELTEAGKTFERYARVLLGLVDEAVSAARFARDAVGAPVRVGATTAAADHMLMPQLARLQSNRPDLQFTLEVGNRKRIWQLLAERSIDVAISSRPPGVGEFHTLATRPNELVVVARPGAVWPSTLGDVTWLVREEGSSTRAAADEVMALLGVSPPLMVIGSNGAIQRSAEAGLGVAVLPSEAVADSLRSRTLTSVHTEHTPLSRPWFVVTRKLEEVAASVKQFVHDLVTVGGEFEWTREGVAATGAGPGGTGGYSAPPSPR